MDEFGEGIGNPFDTPIPGQSLTDEPGNYPWEHPPTYVTSDGAADHFWNRMSEPEFAEQIIAMLDAGVPVEAIVRVMVFGGFMQGKFTPDVGFMMVAPLMKLIAAVGIRAGIKEVRLSLDDLSNNKFLRDMAELKAAKNEIQETAQDIQQELPQSEAAPGLMARPQPQEAI